MKSLKIAFDLDDTLADFVGQFLKNMNDLHGFAPDYEEIADYKLENSVALPTAYAMRLLSATINQVDKLPILEGGLYRAAIGLQEDGHEIRFVTHRPRYTAGLTIDWLKQYELPLNFAFVHSKDKGKYCKERGIDFLFDDNPYVIDHALKEGVDALVFTRPWNYERRELPRVNNSEEVLTLIEMCKGR